MVEVIGDIVQPTALIVPRLTTAVIDTLKGPIGSLVYDTSKNKLSFCINISAGASSWEDVTSS